MTEKNLSQNNWELVLVENASTDDTAAICKEYEQRFPDRVIALSVPVPGKSRALNAALSRAQGEVIAFTDDDVICDDGYITAARKVFEDESIAAAQGRVLLQFEGPVPTWFDNTVRAIYAERDLGTALVPMKANLFGVNMIVRRDVIRKTGAFSPEIGPGTRIPFREDAEFSSRIYRGGYSVVYAPTILVHHIVVVERLQEHTLLTRAFHDGRAEAYLHQPETNLFRYAAYVGKLWFKSTGASPVEAKRQFRSRAGFLYQHILFKLGESDRLSGQFIDPWTPSSMSSKS